MCEFHDCNCNGFGDMWWTDKCTYFSSIDGNLGTFQESLVLVMQAFVDLTATSSGSLCQLPCQGWMTTGLTSAITCEWYCFAVDRGQVESLISVDDWS